MRKRHQVVYGSKVVVSCEAESAVVSELTQRIGNFEEAKEGEKDMSLKVITKSPSSNPPHTREHCRRDARRPAVGSTITITQGGTAVDPNFTEGVIELKLPF